MAMVNRRVVRGVLAVASTVAAVAIVPAHSIAACVNAFTMEILIGGASVTEYEHVGTHYVEARQGQEYTIRLHNPTGLRVAVALSVDGLNSIDAKRTNAADASKWIINPYQTITISGWQTSSSTARRFFFTNEKSSYAKWIGDTRNIGVISAAFYRERTYVIQERSGKDDGECKSRAESQPPSPPSRAAGSPCPAPSSDMAATGIGRETDHSVTRVSLELETTPAACVNVRYEYRTELVRLGVIPTVPEGLDRREHASGFDGMEFAPDPYLRKN